LHRTTTPTQVALPEPLASTSAPGHEVCPVPRVYALIESPYESVKAAWENLFERQYGFWRGMAAPFSARRS